MPLRSIITPMKMNVGIDTSTRFSAAWPQMRGTKLKNCDQLERAEEEADQAEQQREAAQDEGHRIARRTAAPRASRTSAIGR